MLLLLEEEGIEIPEKKSCDLFIAAIGEKARYKAYGLSNELRGQGFNVIIDVCERGLKAQMKYADKIGALYTMVLGDDELASGKAALKNMATGKTDICDIKNVTDCVDEIIRREALASLEESVFKGEKI